MSIKLYLDNISLDGLMEQKTDKWTDIAEAPVNGNDNDKVSLKYKNIDDLQIVLERKNHIPETKVLHIVLDKYGKILHCDKGTNLYNRAGFITEKTREHIVGSYVNPVPFVEAKKVISENLRKDYKPIKKALEVLVE